MTIKAFGLDYEVISGNRELLRAANDAAGAMDPVTQRIYVHPDHSPEQQATDMFHEVIEIVNREMALRLNESTIRRLETSLRTVFAENGWPLPRVEA